MRVDPHVVLSQVSSPTFVSSAWLASRKLISPQRSLNFYPNQFSLDLQLSRFVRLPAELRPHNRLRIPNVNDLQTTPMASSLSSESSLIWSQPLCSVRFRSRNHSLFTSCVSPPSSDCAFVRALSDDSQHIYLCSPAPRLPYSEVWSRHSSSHHCDHHVPRMYVSGPP